MPLISVIVPVYEVEEYLSRCVDSILSNSFTDFELILVDDGSPDRCGEICDGYAKKDQRVIVLHQNNRGLAAARNAGLDWMYENSNSSYVCFVDSDDWVHEKYLELLLQGIQSFSADMSQCCFVKTSDQGDQGPVGDKIVCVSPEEQYSQWYMPFACGKLYRTELFRNIRYPEGKLFEDVLIWYKILFSYSKIAVVDEPLYYYFQRSDGITLSDWTPAKLSQISAWDAQYDFAIQRDNQELLSSVIGRLFIVYKSQYRDINRSTRVSAKEKKKYQLLIKKKLRVIFCRSWKTLWSCGLFLKVFTWAFLFDDGIYRFATHVYQKVKAIK